MKTILSIILGFFFIGIAFSQGSNPEPTSVKDYILGGMDLNKFIASVVFALIGVGISLLINANYRDQNSTSTPYTFSWRFLLRDNWKRILLSFIAILVTLRFTKEIIGWDLNMFVSLLIGVGYDKLVEFIKEKSKILQVNRN